MTRLHWICRRATATMLAILCGAIGGCIGDGFVPAEQQVRVKVVDIRTMEPVSSAKVTAQRLSDRYREQLSPDDMEMLDDGARLGDATAVTDDRGLAVVPVWISGPYSLFGWGGPGPDQVTGRPVGFRIETGSAREYLVDNDTRARHQMKGKVVAVEVQSIGPPKRR